MKLFHAIIVLLFSFRAWRGPRIIPRPKPGDWVAHDFKFHTGEVIGTQAPLSHPGRSFGHAGAGAAWHGGNAASMLNPGFRRRIVRAGTAAGCREILHHHSGRARAMAAAPSHPTG